MFEGVRQTLCEMGPKDTSMTTQAQQKKNEIKTNELRREREKKCEEASRLQQYILYIALYRDIQSSEGYSQVKQEENDSL